jgi:hypothetical protein
VYEIPLDTSDLIGILPPVYGYFGGYVIVDSLLPGYGYWVRCNGSQIILPKNNPKKNEFITEEFFKSFWGKIIFKDASQKLSTLYIVDDKTELDRYQLPPVPPTGSFDIRFSTGRMAENINSEAQSIVISGVDYPLTISVENISVELMDQFGREIKSLKPGTELTINDITINRLMIAASRLIIPDEYSLEQNFPNPFNPTTMIKFSLAETSDVKMIIYNSMGQIIEQIVDRSLAPGPHSIEWNGIGMASGVYFINLKVQSIVSDKSFIGTIKIILLK